MNIIYKELLHRKTIPKHLFCFCSDGLMISKYTENL